MRDDWHILVVEDDPDGQALVSHILEYLRVPIDTVGDAEAAQQRLQSGATCYTAAIIDMALPGMDGWELLKVIRASDDYADLPCIAVTAYHTSKTRQEALAAGFDAYFDKPLEATSFARRLEELLS